MAKHPIGVEFSSGGLTFTDYGSVVLTLPQADVWCLLEFLKAAAVLNTNGLDKITALHLRIDLERTD